MWRGSNHKMNFAQTLVDSPPQQVKASETDRLKEIIHDKLVKSSAGARPVGVSQVETDYATTTAVEATMHLHATMGAGVDGLYLVMPAEHTPFEVSNRKPNAGRLQFLVRKRGVVSPCFAGTIGVGITTNTGKSRSCGL